VGFFSFGTAALLELFCTVLIMGGFGIVHLLLLVRRVLLPRCQGLRRTTVSLDWLFGGSLGFVGVNGIFGAVGLTLPKGVPSSGGSLSVSRPVVLPGRQGGNQVATSPGLVLLLAGAPGAAESSPTE